MKKLVFIIFNVILFYCVNNKLEAQKLTNYSGNYKMGDLTGKANYSYYENSTYERVYEGMFIYSGTGTQSNYGILSVSCKGVFKNDKPDGVWTHTVTTKSGSWKLIMTTVYKNGNRDGLCEAKIDQIDFKGRKSWQKMKTVFSNDTIKSINYINDRKYEANVYLNKEGCFDGEVNVKVYYPEEVISIWKVKNCILELYVEKNNNTGQLIKKIDFLAADVESPFQLNTTSNTSNFLEEVLKFWQPYALHNAVFYNPNFDFMPRAKTNLESPYVGNTLIKRSN